MGQDLLEVLTNSIEDADDLEEVCENIGFIEDAMIEDFRKFLIEECGIEEEKVDNIEINLGLEAEPEAKICEMNFNIVQTHIKKIEQNPTDEDEELEDAEEEEESETLQSTNEPIVFEFEDVFDLVNQIQNTVKVFESRLKELFSPEGWQTFDMGDDTEEESDEEVN